MLMENSSGECYMPMGNGFDDCYMYPSISSVGHDSWEEIRPLSIYLRLSGHCESWDS